jgi:phosphatidylglycerol lysyltransferase
LQDTHSTPTNPTTATAAPHDILYPYILQHGRGILGLSTLQQGLQHFLMPGVGYIAYTTMRNGPDVFNIRTPVALGDPICDPANFGLIAGAFLNKHPKAMFMQVMGVPTYC